MRVLTHAVLRTADSDAGQEFETAGLGFCARHTVNLNESLCQRIADPAYGVERTPRVLLNEGDLG
jgi:hypothetical protein